MKHRDKGVKTHEKFNKNVEKLVMKLGGSVTERPDIYKWQIPTKAGLLMVDVHEPSKSSVFSVFCRFDDVKKANEVLGDNPRLNKHSGKFNYHVYDAKGLLLLMEHEIKTIQ